MTIAARFLTAAPLVPSAAAASPPHSTRRLFALVLACYLALGAALVLGFDGIMEDAMARVSAASSVWSSVDPKLAAVGFVWTPLPALLMVPFTPLRAVWPELVSTGLLAAVLSAVAMAVAVVTVHGILTDLRVDPTVRRTVTALVALQPLLMIYASNGMSEALLLMFLLLATRRLLRWTAGWAEEGGPDGTRLVSAGIFLGLGYLARYEALVAAVAATALVAGITWFRTSRRDRVPAVVADALLVGLPAAAAFLLWAMISWAVVGSPFEQFTSAYGNAALVGDGATGGGVGAMGDVVRQLLWLVPLAAPVLVLAAWTGVRRRDPSVLVPVALFGTVLAFEWVLRLGGELFGFLRYQIALVPLVAVLVALLAVGRRAAVAWAGAVAVLGTALLSSAVLVTTEPVLASQEYLRVRPAVDTVLGHPVTDPGATGMWAGDRALAARLDALGLPPGSVLADTGSAFAVVAASENPRQFLITSDAGFAAALADPPGHGIRYVLRNERGGVDAVRTTWPGFGTPAGPGWATLAATEPGAGRWSYSWTLWAVTSRP